MHHLRRVIPITLGFALASASVLFACSDDDTSVTPKPDGSSPETGGNVDSATPADSGADTSTDSATDTGVDAGPTLTSTTGSAAEIFVANDSVIATFYDDDTIVHWSNAPDCVVFSRAQTKPSSVAGTLTVGGAIVGTDGGADQVIDVTADTMAGNTYFFPGPVFAVDTFTLNVQLSSSLGFPAMPVQTLRPPPTNPVTVGAPVVVDGGAISVPSTAPLTITWTPPAGGFTAQQKISFALKALASAAPGGRLTNLFCAFPLSAGTATIPANVLADMKLRTGGPADANLHVFAGDAKEVKTASSSYFVEVSRTADSTTLAFDVPAKLQ